MIIKNLKINQALGKIIVQTFLQKVHMSIYSIK